MLIETYKGIQILHSAVKDEFYTNIVIRKGTMGKSDEYIRAGRLQAIRDNVDKFLNTAAKKPPIPKAWIKDGYEDDAYQSVEVILFNSISQTAMVKYKDGKIKTVTMSDWNDRNTLFLACKENDAIVQILNKRNAEIKRINKEVSCSSGKLLPLKKDHFS